MEDDLMVPDFCTSIPASHYGASTPYKATFFVSLLDNPS